MALDVREFGAVGDGVSDCTLAFQMALDYGDIIIKEGVYLTSASLKSPSYRYIYGQDASWKKANSSFDNFLRNDDFDNGNTDIRLVGLGNFILDGNSVNNSDAYALYGKNGAESHKYASLMFSGVKNFSVMNIKLVDHPHWGIYFHKCRGGIISDIYLNYYTLIVNQDGLDFAWGNSFIEISNVRGYTADDFTILAAGSVCDACPLTVNYNIGDIHHISYSKIRIYNSANGGLLPLIGGNGNRIYSITMDDAITYRAGSVIFMNYDGYWSEDPAKEDITDIRLSNITVYNNTNNYLFVIGQSCSNISITNLVNHSGKSLFWSATGIEIENFSINGVEYSTS